MADFHIYPKELFHRDGRHTRGGPYRCVHSTEELADVLAHEPDWAAEPWPVDSAAEAVPAAAIPTRFKRKFSQPE